MAKATRPKADRIPSRVAISTMSSSGRRIETGGVDRSIAFDQLASKKRANPGASEGA